MLEGTGGPGPFGALAELFRPVLSEMELLLFALVGQRQLVYLRAEVPDDGLVVLLDL